MTRPNDFLFVLPQQLETIQKALLSLQNGIIESSRIIGRLPAGRDRREAESAMAEFRKADESMRDRLFVLQVWRRYDQKTADKLARMKAGEFLDPELAKILEEREKRHDRDRREREKERERSNRSRRYRGGTAHYSDYPSRLSDSGAYQTTGRSGFGSEYGGRGGNVRGGRRPGPDNKCLFVANQAIFSSNAPKKSKQ